MSARKLPWLIAYDIKSPRRLARLHRWLSRHAAPIQYSVFIGLYDRNDVDWLCKSIRAIIDPRADDVRLYPLPQEPCMTLLGNQRCPANWSLLATLAHPAMGLSTIAVQRNGPRPDPHGQTFD